MSCGCCRPEIAQSARLQHAPFYFSINPFVDLGERLDIACRAMGWIGNGLLQLARGHVWIIDGHATRAPKEDHAEAVHRIAAMAAAELTEPVVVGTAAAMVGERVLYRCDGIWDPVPLDKLFADAVIAADELLNEIGKAAPFLDPSTPQGRAILIRETADGMLAQARPWEASATKAARKILDQNWPGMSKAEQNKVIKAASQRIKTVPLKSVKGINKVISVQTEKVFEGARKGAIQQHKLNIGVSLTAPDRQAIKWQQRTSVRWMTNEYGVRATGYENQARDIVSRGLAAGMGRDQISKDMHRAFSRSVAGRSEAYYNVYAGALVDRSRTRAEMYAYSDATIMKWIASAVIDEVTTDYCRWVDGKVFDVQQTINVMDTAEARGMGVADMKEANPWVRTGLDGRGDMVNYVNGPQGRANLFMVAESGMGTQGKGVYSTLPAGANSGKLADNGIGGPPYHGRCRTTSVADTSTIVSSANIAPVLPLGASKPRKGKIGKAQLDSMKDKFSEDAHLRGLSISGEDRFNEYVKEALPGDLSFSPSKLRSAFNARTTVLPNGQVVYAESETIRKQMRALLARNGMVSKDALGGRVLRDVFRENPGVNACLGTHDWSGGINLRIGWGREIAKFLNGNMTFERVKAMKVFVHEAIHGHSPVLPSTYKNVGRVIEEASTELASHGVMQREFGRLLSKANVEVHMSYKNWVDSVVGKVKARLNITTQKAKELSTAASMELKRGVSDSEIGSNRYIDTPSKLAKEWVDKLPIRAPQGMRGTRASQWVDGKRGEILDDMINEWGG